MKPNTRRKQKTAQDLASAWAIKRARDWFGVFTEHSLETLLAAAFLKGYHAARRRR